ncbi:glutathione S-transferase [Thorsellia anophelis]|uniref:Glutathione S-transferase n=1 Tax=Thorsellia anophelis DSM 18579 TaxID=1123402 RepID=A0A1I0FIZ4_9GAMM|nr:glutathione S-transferase [Thorsellia anophelis]SET57991.1 Glutathione S-transferase [Thorsellia anophelis DSM 18579]
MQLFTSPISPFARKCLITARHVKLLDSIELIKSTAHPVERNASIIAKNPLGQIPTLILDSGEAIYDSRVICEYLNEKGNGSLFGQGQERWQYLTDQSLADGMTDAAILVRYEQGIRPETYQWEEWVNGQLDKITQGLVEFEYRADTLEKRFDIGTISLICALDYISFRLADFPWQEQFPKLANWQKNFSMLHKDVEATKPALSA